MLRSLDFILGLLDRDCPAFIAQEDLAGEHGEALRLWDRVGFLATEREQHPVPSCPHCLEATLCALGGRIVCPLCLSDVDASHLQLRRFNLESFLSWLAAGLNANGGVHQLDPALWQIGTLRQGDDVHECFFRRAGRLTGYGEQRLSAYRNVLLLECISRGDAINGFRGVRSSLLDALCLDEGGLSVRTVAELLERDGTVRFDEGTGTLFVGDEPFGEIPLGNKEYHLLARLWQSVDQFVPYPELKHYVLHQSGSKDTTDEATFCHKLKGRIKDRGWVPKIEALIVTTKKGDGYRLRRLFHDSLKQRVS